MNPAQWREPSSTNNFCWPLIKLRPHNIFLSAFQAFDFCLSVFVGMQNSPLISNMHIKATCRWNARPRTIHTARERILFIAIRGLGIIFVSRSGIRHTRWKGEQTDEYAISSVGGPWGRDAISTALCYRSFFKRAVGIDSAEFSHSYDVLWYITDVICTVFSIE